MVKTYDIGKNMQEDTGKIGQEAKKLPQYVAALSVCMGAVAAGTVLGWTGNIGKALEKGELNDVVADTDKQGWIGSWVTIGAMIMCFPIGYICDLIGRKLAMLLTIIPFTVGWLLIIFCTNVEMIYVGRFLTGLAGGGFCVSAPLYTSEIAQDEIRGTLGTFFQLLLVVGILISYLLGAFVDVQVFSIICAIFPVLFGVLFFFQPETPVYLVKKGNESAALASLEKLRGEGYSCKQEVEKIKEDLSKAAGNVSFWESMKTSNSKKAVLICFGLMFFQQLCGVNAFVFYVGTIFTKSGSTLDPKYATIIVGAVQLAATFVSSQVIDKFGRRLLLLASGLIMALSGFVLAIYFTIQNTVEQSTMENIGWIPITAVIIFFIAFSLGYGPIPWLTSSELMPPEIKANASSAAATFNWFLAFLVTKFYFDISQSIGDDVPLYIFAGVSVGGIVFVYLLLPETKGKSFAQIQEELSGGKPVRPLGLDNPSYMS